MSAIGLAKSNDIIRGGKAQRGFRNLRLKGHAVAPKLEAFRTARTLRTDFLPGLDWSDQALCRNAETEIEPLRMVRTDRTAFLPGIDWAAASLSGEFAAAA